MQAREIVRSIDFETIDITQFDQDRVLDNINAIIRTEELTNELKVTRETSELNDDEVNETIIYSLEPRNDKIRSVVQGGGVNFCSGINRHFGLYFLSV